MNDRPNLRQILSDTEFLGLNELLNDFEDLMQRENALYGRTHKTRDHILAFLSAGNVSDAVIEVDGTLELLDKRPDKPEHKDCELTEAALAVNELLSHSSELSIEDQRTVELLMHVVSETGDVIYNLLQIAILAQQDQLPNAEYIYNSISALFESYNNSDLVNFMANIAREKFSIRYRVNGRKMVDVEEARLVEKYNHQLISVAEDFGSATELLKAIKQLMFDCLAVSIIAASGAPHLLKQIVSTGEIITHMDNGGNEIADEVGQQTDDFNPEQEG